MIALTSLNVLINTNEKHCLKVGTDAPVCPPKHNQEEASPSPQEEGMLPNGMPYKGK